MCNIRYWVFSHSRLYRAISLISSLFNNWYNPEIQKETFAGKGCFSVSCRFNSIQRLKDSKILRYKNGNQSIFKSAICNLLIEFGALHQNYLPENNKNIGRKENA
jgi:hypothetical protein